MEDLSKEFLDVAKHIIDARDLVNPVAHKILDIIRDTTAIMDAAIEYDKKHNDGVNSDESYKHPSPEVIARIKQFAREFKNTDDHDTAILRDRVTELQANIEKYSAELKIRDEQIQKLNALLNTKDKAISQERETLNGLRKDIDSLIAELDEAKGKLIVAENTARNRELDDTEIQLVNVCRTRTKGYTLIHHKANGCKDWITMGCDEFSRKAGAPVEEIWDRLFND